MAAALPEPRDADLIVDEDDTVDHWTVCHQQQIEQTRAITAMMDGS